MRFLTSIFSTFVLVIALVALPNGKAMACGEACCKKEQKQEVKKENTPIKNKKACCSTKKKTLKEDNDKKKSCCSKNKNTQTKDEETEDGCCGKCNGEGCQCSSSNFHFGTINITQLHDYQQIALDSFLYKTSWYFNKKMPNAVYISVWLPPKISC